MPGRGRRFGERYCWRCGWRRIEARPEDDGRVPAYVILLFARRGEACFRQMREPPCAPVGIAPPTVNPGPLA